MTVAIISEDFAGMRAQAEGLVQRLGVPSQFYALALRGIWRNVPARFSLTPLDAVAPIQLRSDTKWILSIGGTGAAIGVALKKKTGLKLVQIQNPRMSLHRFDLIIANCHDQIRGQNVVSTRTALHNVTPSKLAEAARLWGPRLRRPGSQLLSVCLGGSNGRFHFGPEEGRRIGYDLLMRVKQTGAHLAITASRRTDPRALTALAGVLRDVNPYIWTGEGANPYLGLLASADVIAVTQDSVSMISEAVATRAPVEIIPLPGRSRRLTDFISTLKSVDRIRSFSIEGKPWEVSSLDDTDLAVKEVSKRLAGLN